MNHGAHSQESSSAAAPLETVTHALQQGLERTKVTLGDVRERADVIVHERPVLAAVAVGLAGVGIGYLVAHRLERWLVVGVGGAALTALFAPTLKQMRGRVEAAASNAARG